MNKYDFRFLMAVAKAVFNDNKKIIIADKDKKDKDIIIKFKNG